MGEIHQKIKELKLTREEQQKMMDRGFEKLFEIFEGLNTADPSKIFSPKQSPKLDNSTYGGSIQFAQKEEFGSDIDRDSQAMSRNKSQLDRKLASDIGQSILPELYEKPLRQQIEESKQRSKSTMKPQPKKLYVGFESKMSDYNEKLEVE